MSSSYCTVQNVRAILSPDANADDDTTAAGYADDQIEFEIVGASALIDGYLLRHYAYPFTLNGQPAETPDLIVYTCAILAAYQCTLSRSGSDPLEDNDPVVRRLKQAQATLTAIQMNNILLPLDLATAEQTQEDVKIHNHYEGTLFWPGDTALRPVRPNRDDIEGYYSGHGPYGGAW